MCLCLYCIHVYMYSYYYYLYVLYTIRTWWMCRGVVGEEWGRCMLCIYMLCIGMTYKLIMFAYILCVYIHDL